MLRDRQDFFIISSTWPTPRWIWLSNARASMPGPRARRSMPAARTTAVEDLLVWGESLRGTIKAKVYCTGRKPVWFTKKYAGKIWSKKHFEIITGYDPSALCYNNWAKTPPCPVEKVKNGEVLQTPHVRNFVRQWEMDPTNLCVKWTQATDSSILYMWLFFISFGCTLVPKC